MISLATVKTFLGEETTDYDAFLTGEILIITSVINKFTARKLEKSDHTDKEQLTLSKNSVFLKHYPVNSISSVQVDSVDIDYSYDSDSGELTADTYFPPGELIVEYNAGYDDSNIEPLLKSIFLSIIKIRYNKEKAGISSPGEKDVKRLSITGVMTVEYSDKNDSRFNDFLEGFQDALSPFMSERAFI